MSDGCNVRSENLTANVQRYRTRLLLQRSTFFTWLTRSIALFPTLVEAKQLPSLPPPTPSFIYMLHLYVGIDTIEASQEVARRCGLFVNAIARAMMPMEFAEAEANAKKIEIENFHHLLDQKQSEIEVLLQDQRGNALLISALYQTKVNIHKDLAVAQDKYHEAIARKNQAKRDALPVLSDQTIAMIPSMTSFLVAARKELGITTHEARYKAAVQKNADEAKALVAEMLAFADKAVADQIAKGQ